MRDERLASSDVRKVLPVAPEEVTARIAEELAQRERRFEASNLKSEILPTASVGEASNPRQTSMPGTSSLSKRVPAAPAVVVERPTGPILMPADPLYRHQVQAILERLTGPLLLVGLLSLVWMILRAVGVRLVVFPESAEVAVAVSLWGVLFILISALGLFATLRNKA